MRLYFEFFRKNSDSSFNISKAFQPRNSSFLRESLSQLIEKIPSNGMGIIEQVSLTMPRQSKTLKFLQVFIVLKKKNSQLSFLHCYHHGGMVLVAYVAAKWLPGGPGSLLGIINCFVHVIMYSYYFATSIKPKLKESMWWKKYITQVQLTQFAILFVHFLYNSLADNCNYPKLILIFLTVQNGFMFALFADFYRKDYLKKTN